MQVKDFVSLLQSDFYTGVPDSQLKPLCDYLMNTYGINPRHHIIAANEGNCAALAAGYHLATGRIPVVYMQNSGEGNIINPLVSLLHEKVYAIPMVFVIGWRGEPGVHDEPQHVFQGEITRKLLKDIGMDSFIISRETTEEEAGNVMDAFRTALRQGRQTAFVVRKGALVYDRSSDYHNENTMLREEAIRHIIKVSGTDPVISTTGKISRELFEIRKKDGQDHAYDFLTVGSMGHCSSIALGVALQKTNTTVWCLDGDGAALMHMGALPVIASCHPENLVHIVLNNGSHETVGGQPTVMGKLDFWMIARDCGYPYSICVHDFDSLDHELEMAKSRKGLTFIEVKAGIGSRADLGRPSADAKENKEQFMEHLKGI